MQIRTDMSVSAAAISLLNEYKASREGYAIGYFYQGLVLTLRAGAGNAKGDPCIQLYTGEFDGGPEDFARWLANQQRAHGVQVALQTLFEQAQDEALADAAEAEEAAGDGEAAGLRADRRAQLRGY